MALVCRKHDWSSRRHAFHAQLRRQAAKRRAQHETRKDTAPPQQNNELEVEAERRAKRQRSAPLEADALGVGIQAEGKTELAPAVPGLSKEEDGPGKTTSKDAAAERPTEEGASGDGEAAEGRGQDAGQERSHQTEAAPPRDMPPPQPEPIESPHAERQDSPAAFDLNEGDEVRAWQQPAGQRLGESLELHRCGSEPATGGRSASVGPASSAGDSGPAALARTMRSGERGAAGGSASGDRKMVVAKKKGGSKAKRKPQDGDRWGVNEAGFINEGIEGGTGCGGDVWIRSIESGQSYLLKLRQNCWLDQTVTGGADTYNSAPWTHERHRRPRVFSRHIVVFGKSDQS